MEDTLNITSELENLQTIRRFVETRARALGAGPEASADVVLAVNEVVTNIIVHGYKGQPGFIRIEIQTRAEDEESALVVRISDQAFPFDPRGVPPPDLDLPLAQRPVGGLGVYITRQVIDEMVHRVTPGGGNELVLVKRGIANKEGDENDDQSESSAGQGAGNRPEHPGQP